MMLCRIIFFSAVFLAILLVVMLALFSPLPHQDSAAKDLPRPWLPLSLYIQQPKIQTSNVLQPVVTQPHVVGAFIFHHKLTKGPENTSRVIGKAQGFIIPVEDFANSAFNIIYLTFDTPEYSGGLSVQAKHVANKDEQELTVVGGTGSFAFARGMAVFAQAGRRLPVDGDAAATYHVKLQLEFLDPSLTIPG